MAISNSYFICSITRGYASHFCHSSQGKDDSQKGFRRSLWQIYVLDHLGSIYLYILFNFFWGGWQDPKLGGLCRISFETYSLYVPVSGLLKDVKHCKTHIWFMVNRTSHEFRHLIFGVPIYTQHVFYWMFLFGDPSKRVWMYTWYFFFDRGWD